jgi:tight adherence protein B
VVAPAAGSVSTTLLGFAAGALAFLGSVECWSLLRASVGLRLPRAMRVVTAVVDTVVAAGREGRDPGALDRRRLLLAGAVLAFAAGTIVVGVAAGLALACAGPWAAARVLRARHERYRTGVEAGAAALALALADALRGGHSLRGAIAQAAGGLHGPAGRELRRVAAELELGARTEDALEAMRARVRSTAIDTIVGAALLQRRAGGDLARLLRESALALEDQARLEQEVRAATAQARFTGMLVVLLPLGGALLAELASPGYLKSLAGSFLTAWLGGLALIMQAVAGVLIRRLGRVRA